MLFTIINYLGKSQPYGCDETLRVLLDNTVTATQKILAFVVQLLAAKSMQ
jgi:hypothetical protein